MKHFDPVSASGGSGKSGGGGGSVAPDTLFSDAYARVVELISEGPIRGLVNGAKSIFFDNTPLQNADGSFNFQGVDWSMRLGDADQDWLPGYSNVEAETGVGVEVTVAGGPVVRSMSNPDLDALAVTIRFARLLKQDANGSVSATSVQFAVEYKKESDMSWTPFPDSPVTVSGKNSSGLERQFYVLARPVGDISTATWQIRVTRITADHDADPSFADAFTWQSFTEIIESKFTYPDTAYIGLQAPASAFSGGTCNNFTAAGAGAAPGIRGLRASAN